MSQSPYLIFGFFVTTLAANEVIIISNIDENNGTTGKPNQYCVIDSGKKYSGFSYRIFGKNILVDHSFKIKPKKLYLLKGQWEKDLTKHIKEIGSCDPKEIEFQQIRSDWLPEENYFQGKIISWKLGHTKWARLQELSFFHATKVAEFTSIQCHIKKKKFFFEFPIDSFKSIKAKVISHYESREGKPKPKYLTKGKRFSEKVKLEFPLFLSEGKLSYRLQEVSIQSEGKNFLININYPIFNCKTK